MTQTFPVPPARQSGIVTANGIEIAYEDWGPAQAPPVLLIMGLGTQLLGWPEPFCRALAQAGLRVIRFDNRDVGLSQKMEGLPAGDDPRVAFLKSLLGMQVRAPYLLDAMAADTAGLIDALGLARAHVVGASMGGMIAQIVAARYPRRTASLTSMISTSGARGLPRGKLRVLMRLASTPKSKRTEDIVAHLVTTMRMIGSPGMQYSRAQWAEQIAAALARGYYPPGTTRQLLAVMASPGREALLREITVPSLVIHGDADPLIPLENGRHTAECIPRARLEIFPGMAHDLPPPLQVSLAETIAAHAHAAGL